MNQSICAAVLGAAIAFGVSARSNAQQMDFARAPIPAPVYDPPGYYGMAWGVPSYGVPRTASNFSSPFSSVGYGYGYNPYHLMPGRFGASLWRPGELDPGFGFAQGSYRTFPITRGGVTPPSGVPVGFYAPRLGPPMITQP